ncbi:30479_t:CDS:1, partial [Racocetra persica]
CKVSQRIWNITYNFLTTSSNDKPPQTFEEVFSASNITEPRKRIAA